MHFLEVGALEGRRPSIEFDPRGYLMLNEDVRNAGIEPLRHYVERGMFENRAMPSSRFDRARLMEARERIAASGLFDAEFYLSANPVAHSQRVDPILHYLLEGAATYQDPSPTFCTVAYAMQNPEVIDAREPALLHYLRRGVGSPLPRSVDEVRRSRPLYGQRLRDEGVTLARMAAGSFFARNGFTFEASGPTTYVPDAVSALAKREPSLQIDARAPDVSIVIPVYGQVPFVLACLEFLAGHRSRYSVEIIIADDASPAGVSNRPDSVHSMGPLPPKPEEPRLPRQLQRSRRAGSRAVYRSSQ